MNNDQHLDDAQFQVLLESRLEPAAEEIATRHIASCETCQVRLSQLAEATDVAARLDRLKESAVPYESSTDGNRPAVLERLKEEFVSRVTGGYTWDNANAQQDTSIGMTPPPPNEVSPNSRQREMPSKLGRYQIEKSIGQGGQATVYRAYDTEMERHVALKVPKTSNWELQGGKKRFMKEVKAASRLDHPNICRNLDVGEIDGIPYLTMSFVEGSTLDRWAANNRSLEEILLVVERVAMGLAAAHGAGVVHRDLKPSNIMIKQDLEPVIMDFGLAHRLDSEDDRLTITGSVVGTPLYMSPEQVTGKHKEIGPATDLYTLGVILYELLTGKAPFRGSMETVFGQILHAPPPAPSEERGEVPPVLDALCGRAMAKDPAERFSSAEEFAAAVAAARESLAQIESAKTIIVSSAEQVTESSKTNYWPLVGGVVTIGLVAFAIAGVSNNWFKLGKLEDPATPPTIAGDPSADLPSAAGTTGIASTVEPSSAEAPEAAQNTDQLEVATEIHFQRAAQKTGYDVLQSDLLPLRDNDKIQIHVNVSTPAYVYLWWYDAMGKPMRLRPSGSEQEVTSAIAEPPETSENGRQRWHVLGAELGYELVLAGATREALSEAELKAFETVQLRIAEQSSGGELLALTRGLIGTVASEKGERVGDEKPTRQALLVLPEARLGELVVVSPTALDRGLIGTVSTVKGEKIGEANVDEMVDLRTLLSDRFDSYYGLVIRHEE